MSNHSESVRTAAIATECLKEIEDLAEAARQGSRSPTYIEMWEARDGLAVWLRLQVEQIQWVLDRHRLLQGLSICAWCKYGYPCADAQDAVNGLHGLHEALGAGCCSGWSA